MNDAIVARLHRARCVDAFRTLGFKQQTENPLAFQVQTSFLWLSIPDQILELTFTILAQLSFQLPTTVFIIDAHIDITLVLPLLRPPIYPYYSFPIFHGFRVSFSSFNSICGRSGSGQVISRTQQRHELKISSRLALSVGARSAQVDFSWWWHFLVGVLFLSAVWVTFTSIR